MTGKRPGRYLAGQAGRDAYAAQAARDTTPRGDPQRTGPWRDPREYVAEVTRPCAACWHSVALHDLTPAGKRTGCTTVEGTVPCRCARLDGPHDFARDPQGICRRCRRPFLDAGKECTSVP